MKYPLVVAVSLLSLWACGDEPAPPAPTSTPPPPAAPTVQALRITGPSTLVDGQTAQLSAATALSDGTIATVSPSSVHWHSSNAVVATISTTGVLQARQAGLVDVRGTYGQWTSGAVTVKVTRDPCWCSPDGDPAPSDCYCDPTPW
jgi:hypothetical protein